MQAFNLLQPGAIDDAIAAAQAHGTKYIAGGSDLMQLMKDNVEVPTQLVTAEMELEVSLGKLFFHQIIAEELIGSPIPQHHTPGAVVTLGNHALKRPVFEGVILHHHG